MVEVQSLGKLLGHKSSIYTIQSGFEPGSLISSGGDGWIVNWHPGQSEDGRLLAKIEEQVYCCAVWKEGGAIIAGSMSGALYLIPLEDESPRKIVFHRKSIYDILLRTNDFITISGDGTICIWSYDLKPLESIVLAPQGLRSIHCSTERLYVGGKDGHIYILGKKLDLQNRFLAHSGAVFSITEHAGQLISGALDAHLKIWDAASFDLRNSLQAHYFTINDILFISNANIFATASRDKSIRLWDSSTWELKKVIDRPKFDSQLGSINSLVYFEENNLLCSASDDNSIYLWHIKMEI